MYWVIFLSALLALFLELLKGRHHGRHELDDDRGGDVGHNAKREDPHPRKRPTCKERKHPTQARGRLVHELPQGDAVDAGHGDVCAEPVDDEQPNREQDTLAEVSGFAKRAPAQVGGHLFCG